MGEQNIDQVYKIKFNEVKDLYMDAKHFPRTWNEAEMKHKVNKTTTDHRIALSLSKNVVCVLRSTFFQFEFVFHVPVIPRNQTFLIAMHNSNWRLT